MKTPTLKTTRFVSRTTTTTQNNTNTTTTTATTRSITTRSITTTTTTKPQQQQQRDQARGRRAGQARDCLQHNHSWWVLVGGGEGTRSQDDLARHLSSGIKTGTTQPFISSLGVDIRAAAGPYSYPSEGTIVRQPATNTLFNKTRRQACAIKQNRRLPLFRERKRTRTERGFTAHTYTYTNTRTHACIKTCRAFSPI